MNTGGGGYVRAISAFEDKNIRSIKNVFFPKFLFQNTIDAIHRAVKEGSMEKVKELIKGKRLALARDRHGCTPLHTAIIHEQTEVRASEKGPLGQRNFQKIFKGYNSKTLIAYLAREIFKK